MKTIKGNFGIKRGVEPLALAKMCCSLLRALILIKTSYTFMKKINPCANARSRTSPHTAKIWQNTVFGFTRNIGFLSAPAKEVAKIMRKTLPPKTRCRRK